MTESIYKNALAIDKHVWHIDALPLVSISCLSYNHENYIRVAIESFLFQKTTFLVEILIHDDASTDKTVKIVKEYEEKYPKIIKAIYQTENQYQKRDGTIGRLQRERARGKYIAICEGDDYWTDPYKLQKQVDFLEANPGFVITAHEPHIVFEDVPIKENFYKKPSTGNFEFSFKEEFMNHFIPTASVVFSRKAVEGLPDCFYHCISGDIPLFLYILTKGKGYYFMDKMAVKRRNPGGITLNEERQKVLYLGMYHLWVCVQKFSPLNCKHLVKERLAGYERGLAKRYRSLNIYKALYYFGKSFLNDPKWYLKKIRLL